MRKFIKQPFVVLVLLIIGTITAGYIFFKTCTHEVTYRGIVLSHTTTSDKHGDITYYTIARFEDRTIRSLEGLNYYVVEVGGTVHYTQTELNK
jgi:hypothetical protein